MRPAHPAFRRGVAHFSALCVLGFLSGCGSSSPAAISASSATTLHRDVQSIRSAAGEQNAQKAHAATGAFRRDIGRLVARGALARSDARVLMLEAGQVDGRVSAEVKPVSSAPATPPPSAVSPPTPSVGNANGNSDGNGNGNGNGHGKGHGHGRGGGDGGD